MVIEENQDWKKNDVKVVARLNKKDIDTIFSEMFKINAENYREYLHIWCKDFVEYEDKMLYVAGMIDARFEGYIEELNGKILNAAKALKKAKLLLDKDKALKLGSEYVNLKKVLLLGVFKINETINNATEELELIDFFASELCRIIDENPKYKNKSITYSEGKNEDLDAVFLAMITSEEEFVDKVEKCDSSIKRGIDLSRKAVDSFIGLVDDCLMLYGQVTDDSHGER